MEKYSKHHIEYYKIRYNLNKLQYENVLLCAECRIDPADIDSSLCTKCNTLLSKVIGEHEEAKDSPEQEEADVDVRFEEFTNMILGD